MPARSQSGKRRAPSRGRKNPQAISYLQVAKRAALKGDYPKTVRILKKYAAKSRKQLREDDERLVRQGFKEKNRRVRNQGAAGQLYEDFHGRKSQEVIRLQEALMKSGDYTALGDDPEFWIRAVSGDPKHWPAPDIEFEPKDKVKLATDAKGKRLYIVGGRQKLSAEALGGFDTSERFVNLGTCYGISYQTEKIFDGFKTTTYVHEFGEETGERPELIYDKEGGRLLLVGGAYKIAGVDRALKASPGIVN